MADRYGEDVFEQLFQNWWRAEAFEDVFLLTTGETLAAFDEAWLYKPAQALSARYRSERSAFADGFRAHGEGFNIKPTIVPGQTIA